MVGKGKFNLTNKIKSARDLEVYKLAFAAAMEIFNITKSFPALDRKYEQILGMLNSMEIKADKFCFPKER